MILITIYIFTIALCLAFSIYNELARQRLLWLYFGIVLAIESAKIFRLGNISSVIYTYSSLCYILFFLYYFKIVGINKTIIIITGILSIVLYGYFIIHVNHEYPVAIGVLMSFVFIILSLIWFGNQLLHIDIIRIQKKQAFWVSFSLLIWAVFFLFRLVPMYWLNVNDVHFLKSINLGYQIITIVSYFVFLRGLFCKY